MFDGRQLTVTNGNGTLTTHIHSYKNRLETVMMLGEAVRQQQDRA